MEQERVAEAGGRALYATPGNLDLSLGVRDRHRRDKSFNTNVLDKHQRQRGRETSKVASYSLLIEQVRFLGY